jgi:hypothetical protein
MAEDVSLAERVVCEMCNKLEACTSLNNILSPASIGVIIEQFLQQDYRNCALCKDRVPLSFVLHNALALHRQC